MVMTIPVSSINEWGHGSIATEACMFGTRVSQRIIFSLTFSVCSVAMLSSCGGGGEGEGGQPPPTEVNVAQVVQKKVRIWDEFTGRVVASETVEIRPRVGGYLREIAFREGGLVRKGQRLFVIDTRPYEAQVARARAEVARARSASELARSERARADRLIAAKAISREEYEQRINGDRSAQAGIEVAEAALRTAQLDLDYALIESPIDGRIGASALRVGNLVDTNTLLTTIVTLDPMFVYFDGDETTYLKYGGMARSGERPSSRDARNPVMIGIADEDGYPHEGYMDFVDNQIDPSTGTIRARAVVSNADGKLTPGLFARVRLIGSGERNALLIHDAAVLTDQDRKYVYVVGPKNEALRKDVKLGATVDGLRIVDSGLAPTDRVVVNGVRKIFFPGMPVKPLNVPMDKPDTPPPPPPAGATAPAAGG
jgi:membrane fusion protein, multidrug efflux system